MFVIDLSDKIQIISGLYLCRHSPYYDSVWSHSPYYDSVWSHSPYYDSVWSHFARVQRINFHSSWFVNRTSYIRPLPEPYMPQF
jgi:hypothetical protein